ISYFSFLSEQVFGSALLVGVRLVVLCHTTAAAIAAFGNGRGCFFVRSEFTPLDGNCKSTVRKNFAGKNYLVLKTHATNALALSKHILDSLQKPNIESLLNSQTRLTTSIGEIICTAKHQDRSQRRRLLRPERRLRPASPGSSCPVSATLCSANSCEVCS